MLGFCFSLLAAKQEQKDLDGMSGCPKQLKAAGPQADARGLLY